MKVIGAYLESLLDRDAIFMNIPQGLQVGREGLVCRILKSLYGLKQAGRLWNKTIIAFFNRNCFIEINGDPCILVYRREDDLVIVGIYVDDLLIGANTDRSQWTKTLLRNEFNMMDLGTARTIIGWQIRRDLKAGTLLVGQWNYVRDLLESEGMANCNPCNLPMKAGSFLDTDRDGDSDEADLKAYQSLVGKLMHLACGTRPDISFIVGQLGRHNSDPRVGHMRIAKQVVRYLEGTASLSLCYARDVEIMGHRKHKYGLIGYAGLNYAGDPEDRKSFMGYCFFFNGALATWSSKKQRTVSTLQQKPNTSP